MSKIKKIIGIILSIFLILSSVPILASAEYTYYTSDDGYLTYYIKDGEAIINDCDTSISGSCTIPDTLGGYPVTIIVNYTFQYCTSLTSVIIGSSVTSIYECAFIDCTSLISITVDENNKYYSNDSQGVLFNKNKTKLLYCPGGSTSCVIPDSVTSIGEWAFYGCASLTSVTIPDSVISFNEYAFDGCTSLTSVTIPDSVTSIGYGAFYGCTSLASVTIPDSVTSIGYCAFCDCTSLTSITIPDSVTSIEYGTFGDCTSLISITIPDSVTSIGGSAFYNTAYYNDDSNWEDGVLYIGNHLIRAQIGISGSYEIKAGTITIPGSAFYKCTSLESITIPDSVTSIGEAAFSDCTSLESITIPDSVTSIGSYAFYECASLESITIPDGVTTIGDETFYECISLISVTIGAGVTRIGEWAFRGCTLLTSVNIPDSVISIGEYAFEGCESLTSITIPGSITSIGRRALGYTFDSRDVLIDGFAIYGYDGTAAETYANNEGITFISLGEYVAPVQTTTSAVLDEDGSQSAGLAAEGESQTADGSGSMGTFGYILIAAVVFMVILAAAAVVIVVVVSKRKKPHYTGTYNQ